MTIVTVGIDLVTAGVMLDNPYVLIAVGEVANALTVCASGPSDLPGCTFRFGLEQAGRPHNAQRSTPFNVDQITPNNSESAIRGGNDLPAP